MGLCNAQTGSYGTVKYWRDYHWCTKYEHQRTADNEPAARVGDIHSPLLEKKPGRLLGLAQSPKRRHPRMGDEVRRLTEARRSPTRPESVKKFTA
mmetsp:Transcript_19631/g.32728  ORF Transcript_19631/g.32728 Transcript_19631/m.32728 type:complete len:95 (-) Transcript_19631:43-327(-)